MVPIKKSSSPPPGPRLADVGAADEDGGGQKHGVHLGEVKARLLHWVLPGLALGPHGGAPTPRRQWSSRIRRRSYGLMARRR